MKIEVQRRYLVWREETWTHVATDVGAVQHMIDNHPNEFDDELLRFGELGDIAVIEIEDPIESQRHYDVDAALVPEVPTEEVLFDYEEEQGDGANVLQFKPRET